MNKLLQLIDERIKSALDSFASPSMTSGIIQNVNGDEADVLMLETQTIVTLKNYSGSNIKTGDSVQIMYRGRSITKRNAYICTSPETQLIIPKGEYNPDTAKDNVLYFLYDDEEDADGNIEVLRFYENLGTYTDVEYDFATLDFTAMGDTTAMVQCTVIMTADETNNVAFKLYIDDAPHILTPMQTIPSTWQNTCTFNFMVDIAAGSHTAKITINGAVTVSAAECVMWGNNIEERAAEPTTSDDYQYTIQDGYVKILKYIGVTLYPAVPDTIEDLPVKIIGGSTFIGTNVKYVYIPDGVEIIE